MQNINDKIQYILNTPKKSHFNSLGKTFQSNNKYYFFDSGTGKVLECSQNVFIVLSYLEKNDCLAPEDLNLKSSELSTALDDIIAAIISENILKATYHGRLLGEQNICLNQSIKKLKQICLEVTQECNLRCKYCIYQPENKRFRDYGMINMDFQTAKTALDYFLKNADSEKATVAFYGGEPLLNYDLVQQCIDYIQNKNPSNREISFSMTTNGTLLTKEKAEYFSSIPNFSIVFSIDGDESTHNSYRVFPNGRGSFDLAITGFYNALEAYGKKSEEFIMINSVIAPPYTESKFNSIQKFFNDNARNISKLYSYVEYGDEDDSLFLSKLQEVSSDEEWKPLSIWEEQKDDKQNLFTWSETLRGLLPIHYRMISNLPIEFNKFNGCCVPAGRKLYVTAEGNYKVCERVGECPEIGDVNHGVDVKSIKKWYVEDYEKKSIEQCDNCWAVNLCGVCYATCYDKNGLNIDKKRLICQDEKRMIADNLIRYHQLLESNPEVIKMLNEMTFE